MNEISFRKTISRMSLAYFTAMLTTTVIQFLLNILINIFIPGFADNPAYLWLLSTVPLYFAGLPLAYIIINKLPDCDEQKEAVNLPVGKFIKLFFIGYACMYIGNIVSMILSSIVTMVTGKVLINPIETVIERSGLFITFIATVIVAPIGEEFFFRYLPYKKLSKYGDKVYMMITALFFAIFHLNIFQVVYAFLLGNILAYLYARTRNMLYNVAMHMIINFIGAIAAVIVQENAALTTIFGITVMTITLIGLVLLFMNFRRAVYTGSIQPYSQHPVKDTFLNLGMILFICFFIADNVITIINS